MRCPETLPICRQRLGMKEYFPSRHDSTCQLSGLLSRAGEAGFNAMPHPQKKCIAHLETRTELQYELLFLTESPPLQAAG